MTYRGSTGRPRLARAVSSAAARSSLSCRRLPPAASSSSTRHPVPDKASPSGRSRGRSSRAGVRWTVSAGFRPGAGSADTSAAARRVEHARNDQKEPLSAAHCMLVAAARRSGSEAVESSPSLWAAAEDGEMSSVAGNRQTPGPENWPSARRRCSRDCRIGARQQAGSAMPVEAVARELRTKSSLAASQGARSGVHERYGHAIELPMGEPGLGIDFGRRRGENGGDTEAMPARESSAHFSWETGGG